MTDLEKFQKQIHARGSSLRELNRTETIEALDVIAMDMMTGNFTLNHASALLAIRFGLMTPTEQDTEYKTLTKGVPQ